MSARCRSCNAEIVWAFTVNGKRMPLDAEPSPAGTFIVRDDKLESAIGAELDELRYSSHFATCPHADEHRRSDR